MQEILLHYIWQFRQYTPLELTTQCGQSIQVLKVGTHNLNAGPDFENARLRIGDLEWAGQVEIHIHSSDWNKHGHQYDAAYNNVVLHVVWERVFYQSFCRAVGLKINATPMERLTQLLPQIILAKHRGNVTQLEALLFGVAGFLADPKDAYSKELSQEFRFLKHKYRLVEMSKSDWKFFRLRPSAFPTVRLAQLAQLMHHNTNLFACIMDQEKLKGITQLLQLQLSDYWNTHYQFDHKSVRRKKSFGKGLINNIIINTIIPFYLSALKIKGGRNYSLGHCVLKEMKAENNHIVRRFQTHGVSVENAGKTQALLHLKKVYCDAKKCLNCSIASQWLKT